MHHLDKEKVEAIMEKVKQVVDSGHYPADIIEEIFKLSDVDGEKFLECKAHPIQKEKVNFEIDPEKGVRFFDPFNFFTRGIYKDMDGLTVWTTDNLKEPSAKFHISLTPMTLLVVIIGIIGTVELGIYPDPIIALTHLP